YTEVGNFINAQNPDTGIWEKSQPRFVVTATGLESRGSAARVVLMNDIAQPSAISVTSSDGVTFHSTPLGLSLNDGLSAIVIAQIKSSAPVLIATNIALYPDCFSGAARASVRVVLTRAGAEVDVVLAEQLAVDPAADLKMDLQKLKLEVITEAFQNSIPARSAASSQSLSTTNGASAQLKLADSTLRVGTL